MGRPDEMLPRARFTRSSPKRSPASAGGFGAAGGQSAAAADQRARRASMASMRRPAMSMSQPASISRMQVGLVTLISVR